MKSNNNAVIPEAREALDKFKMEAASEVGVDLKQGYNGHLTSREAALSAADGQEDDRGIRAQHEVIPPQTHKTPGSLGLPGVLRYGSRAAKAGNGARERFRIPWT